MNFFTNDTTKPSISAIGETFTPKIIISKIALLKMQAYIEGCNNEIGWLGVAYKEKDFIYIQDVYLFEQDVHTTTTEITPEGLEKFANIIMQEPNGMEIWNNLKVWGHSHVDMGVFASTQDNNQMVTFAEGGHDWFLRIIGNKKGDIRLDLYDYNLGIIYSNLRWMAEMTKEEEKIYDKIEKLKKLLADYQSDLVTLIKKEITEEINKKVNVKKNMVVLPGRTNYPSIFGQKNYSINGEISQTNTENENNAASSLDYIPQDDGTIRTMGDVIAHFDDDFLYEIGACLTLAQVELLVEEIAMSKDMYEENELRLIWETGQTLLRIKRNANKGGNIE